MRRRSTPHPLRLPLSKPHLESLEDRTLPSAVPLLPDPMPVLQPSPVPLPALAEVAATPAVLSGPLSLLSPLQDVPALDGVIAQPPVASPQADNMENGLQGKAALALGVPVPLGTILPDVIDAASALRSLPGTESPAAASPPGQPASASAHLLSGDAAQGLIDTVLGLLPLLDLPGRDGGHGSAGGAGNAPDVAVPADHPTRPGTSHAAGAQQVEDAIVSAANQASNVGGGVDDPSSRSGEGDTYALPALFGVAPARGGTPSVRPEVVGPLLGHPEVLYKVLEVLGDGEDMPRDEPALTAVPREHERTAALLKGAETLPAAGTPLGQAARLPGEPARDGDLPGMTPSRLGATQPEDALALRWPWLSYPPSAETEPRVDWAAVEGVSLPPLALPEAVAEAPPGAELSAGALPTDAEALHRAVLDFLGQFDAVAGELARALTDNPWAPWVAAALAAVAWEGARRVRSSRRAGHVSDEVDDLSLSWHSGFHPFGAGEL